MADQPLAYLITWGCYGTWLHGDERGSVDRLHNQPGTAFLPADPPRRLRIAQRMTEPPALLSPAQRRHVEESISRTCERFGWHLRVVNCRSNHVHVVLSAPGQRPKPVRQHLKGLASKALNELAAAKRRHW